MSKAVIPPSYIDKLSLYETQVAIGMLKRKFEDRLKDLLNLKRVSAPLFVDSKSGINDDLNGFERPVEFEIAETKCTGQVVHSLAKWKRMALYKYGFSVGEGLYTDMNAIRRDEEMDNIHSIYVDQWDWEKVIERKDRNLDYLKNVASLIVSAICDTQEYINLNFSALSGKICRKISFITTYELEDLYPNISAKEREFAYLKEHKTALIMQIGDKLKSGEKHDGRAPDYDDWTLNADLLFWNDVLGQALEISSMGIRVDDKSLDEQLKKSGCESRKKFEFHSMLLEGKLPLTIGGGIGQSRLCMLILEKAHIGEVQVSIWDKETEKICKDMNINLL